MTQSTTGPARGGPADVLYVLVLVQVAAGLLAMVGAVIMMGGNPVYAVVPIVKAVAMLLVVAAVRRGRRWSMITLIVLELVTVAGFWIGVLAGLLREIDHTLNLVELLTAVALPVAICWLCAQLLAAQPRRPRRARGRRRPPVPAAGSTAPPTGQIDPLADPAAPPTGQAGPTGPLAGPAAPHVGQAGPVAGPAGPLVGRAGPAVAPAGPLDVAPEVAR